MRKKLTTYIEENMIKKLKINAIERNLSVADILNDLVKEYLDKIESTTKK